MRSLARDSVLMAIFHDSVLNHAYNKLIYVFRETVEKIKGYNLRPTSIKQYRLLPVPYRPSFLRSVFVPHSQAFFSSCCKRTQAGWKQSQFPFQGFFPSKTFSERKTELFVTSSSISSNIRITNRE